MLSPYEAARESAVLFDLSARAKVELSGKDAREFLHNLCTQDVKNLPVGEWREAFLTTNKARVLAHLWIWHREPNVLLLDFTGPPESVLKHLNHYLISEQVEITDRTSECAMFRVVGPKAEQLLSSISIIPARRHRLLALDGCDLFCPAVDAEVLRQRLMDVGVVFGNTTAHDTLRIEAGLPEYGIDITEDRLAIEVNRPEAISYTKGCYLGQETIVMARDRGQVNRRMMGLVLSAEAPAPPIPGRVLDAGQNEVGQVTSAVFSPRLQRSIALAYMKRGSWDVGTKVVVESAGDAMVSALPFSSVRLSSLAELSTIWKVQVRLESLTYLLCAMP